MNRLECQLFYENLKNLFQQFSRVSFLTADFETIFLKYQTMADIGTLSQSAEVSHKYLHLQDGDIVLTNDPYSGGTILSSPTLILGIGTKTVKGQTPAEFLLASRLTLTPRVGAFKTIDEEGLRIPPSPLYIRGELNTPIVEALKAHPQIAKNFTTAIDQEAKKLLAFRETFKKYLTKNDFGKNRIRAFLDATEKELNRRLSEIGEGVGSAEIILSPKETLKLKVEHHDNHFTFDFTGTTPGSTLFLTDSATIGTVVGSTLSLLRENVPVNSGIFSHFDVKAPRGSLVNSAFPRPLGLGHTDGVNIIANAVFRCLALINKKATMATSGSTHCSYEIQFRDRRTFVDSLPTGIGANESGSGLSGVNLWRRFDRTPSIENLESLFAIQFLSSGFRTQSGGEGKHSGGQGVVRSIKLLDDADFKWAVASPQHKPEGHAGGKAALGAEIIVIKTDGSKLELTTTFSGSIPLTKGDTITVMSPGGGGFNAN
jgi:N-methylhydantoinase B